MRPAPRIPDSLIIPTIGQSRLARLNYCRIIVIRVLVLTCGNQYYCLVLSSISPKGIPVLLFFVSPGQKMASTFNPTEIEICLLLIHCMGAMTQESIDMWCTHPIHLFGYDVPGSVPGIWPTLVNKNDPSPCRASHLDRLSVYMNVKRINTRYLTKF